MTLSEGGDFKPPRTYTRFNEMRVEVENGQFNSSDEDVNVALLLSLPEPVRETRFYFKMSKEKYAEFNEWIANTKKRGAEIESFTEQIRCL